MAKNPNQELIKGADFAARLGNMMNEAAEMGLWQTMQKIHEAVKQVGWELAERKTKQIESGK